MSKITTRKEAIEEGLKYYFTGNPCKHGHISKRKVKCSTCYACHLQQSRNSATKYSERRKKTKSLWSEEQKTKDRDSKKKYVESEKGQIKIKEYLNSDKGKETRSKAVFKYSLSEKGKISLRKNHLKRKYNLTLEDYDKMVLSQEGKCKICKKIPTKNLYVDHCHKTGRIRGLLCKKCNIGLGYFGDNVEGLQLALEYLLWAT